MTAREQKFWLAGLIVGSLVGVFATRVYMAVSR